MVEVSNEDKNYMFTLFQNGVIGTKEFRNWLAKVDGFFSDVRDSDVDNEIDALARQRRESLERPPVQAVDREGFVRGE